MKISIIGSRTFNDYKLLCENLNQIKSHVTMVISGGAKGADSLGERWAKENGIETLIFYPDWDKYGKGAGFIRNSQIIENSDGVIAFWDEKSRGTLDSINKAKKMDKKLKIVTFE